MSACGAPRRPRRLRGMTNTKLATVALLAASAACLIAYDVAIFVESAPGAASEAVVAASAKNPVWPWASGALLGHLFIPSDEPRSTSLKLAGAAALAAMLIAGLAFPARAHDALTGWPVFDAAVGMACGVLLCPRAPPNSRPRSRTPGCSRRTTS